MTYEISLDGKSLGVAEGRTPQDAVRNFYQTNQTYHIRYDVKNNVFLLGPKTIDVKQIRG